MYLKLLKRFSANFEYQLASFESEKIRFTNGTRQIIVDGLATKETRQVSDVN